LINRASKIARPSPFPVIEQATHDQHERILAEFDNFIQSRPTRSITINDVTITKREDLLRADFPPKSVIQPFLLRYMGRTKGRKDKNIAAGTLLTSWIQFCAALKRFTWKDTPPQARKDGMDFCNRLIKKFGLITEPPTRTRLDAKSVYALVDFTWKMPGWSIRYKLSIVLFINLECSTALRPSEILSYRGAPAGTGAVYSDFHLWAVAAPDPKDQNLIYGYYIPRYSKTNWGKGMKLPLVPGKDMVHYPGLYILLALVADGGLKRQTLQRLLAPGSIPAGSSRRIYVPAKWQVLCPMQPPMMLTYQAGHARHMQCQQGAQGSQDCRHYLCTEADRSPRWDSGDYYRLLLASYGCAANAKGRQ
jgi:hypothetical protein